jgi:hypothetical protein
VCFYIEGMDITIRARPWSLTLVIVAIEGTTVLSRYPTKQMGRSSFWTIASRCNPYSSEATPIDLGKAGGL